MVNRLSGSCLAVNFYAIDDPRTPHLISFAILENGQKLAVSQPFGCFRSRLQVLPLLGIAAQMPAGIVAALGKQRARAWHGDGAEVVVLRFLALERDAHVTVDGDG